MGGGGIQTSAFGSGGYIDGTGDQNITEEYDGTNWTSGGALINSRHAAAGAGATNTAGLIFGGNPIPSGVGSKAEGYDGTSFSTRPNLATARARLAGCGTETLALAFGGASPTIRNQTEEFTGETTSINVKTLTQS
jgi:hypothetical protein